MDEHKNTNASESELNAGLDLIYGLIFSTGSPEATELVKNNEQFSQIYDYLVELRQIVISFAKGDFTKDVKLRGFLGGSLKNLQANLRHFFNLALSEVARLKRNNGVITLCMLDVDFFKKFNDNYGHLNGDLCLQQLTKTAQSTLRQMDIMGRYGGEEFIFLFPETAHEAGVQVAERLRSAIEETPIELDDGRRVGITVSIGVTAIEGSKITNKPDIVLREAVQLADAALYKAKAEGRNKVISSFDSDWGIFGIDYPVRRFQVLPVFRKTIRRTVN